MTALAPPEARDLAGPSWRDRADRFLAELAAELAPEAREWAELARAAAPEVHDDATREAAAGALRVARDAAAALERRRKVFTEPLHEVKSRIDALFRPLRSGAESLEQAHRDAINAYDTAREHERRAAMRAAAAQEPEAPLVPAPPAPVAGVQARLVWRFRIVDASKVPRELCSPDEAKIKARGPGEIPGIEWYEESEVRIR